MSSAIKLDFVHLYLCALLNSLTVNAKLFVAVPTNGKKSYFKICTDQEANIKPQFRKKTDLCYKYTVSFHFSHIS